MITIIDKKELSDLKENRAHTRRKIDQLETRQAQDIKECNARHDLHDEYKLHTNNSLDKLSNAVISLDSTIKKVIELTPTMERSRNNFTTLDTLKSWFIYIAVAYAAFEIFVNFVP